MKSIQDALYNWLSIKIVSDERQDDTAAKKTATLFERILREEHLVSNLKVTTDETMYFIQYFQDGEEKSNRFPRELVEVILHQINEQPEKYVNYPDEKQNE